MLTNRGFTQLPLTIEQKNYNQYNKYHHIFAHKTDNGLVKSAQPVQIKLKPNNRPTKGNIQ